MARPRAHIQIQHNAGPSGIDTFTAGRATRRRQRGRPKAQLAIGYAGQTARPWAIR